MLSFRYHSIFDRDTQGAHRYQRGPVQSQIQLYYSSFDVLANIELTEHGYLLTDTSLSFEFVHCCSRFQFLHTIDHSFRCVEDRVVPSQRQFFHIKAVTLKEAEEKDRVGSRTEEEKTCLNMQEVEELEELSLDPYVLIRYPRGLVLTGQPVRVSVNLRGNFSAEFAVIR